MQQCFSSQSPDASLHGTIATPQKFQSPTQTPALKTCIHFYLFLILVLSHVPLQTFLDFNAIYILIELVGSYRAMRLCLLNRVYP